MGSEGNHVLGKGVPEYVSKRERLPPVGCGGQGDVLARPHRLESELLGGLSKSNDIFRLHPHDVEADFDWW